MKQQLSLKMYLLCSNILNISAMLGSVRMLSIIKANMHRLHFEITKLSATAIWSR